MMSDDLKIAILSAAVVLCSNLMALIASLRQNKQHLELTRTIEVVHQDDIIAHADLNSKMAQYILTSGDAREAEGYRKGKTEKEK